MMNFLSAFPPLTRNQSLAVYGAVAAVGVAAAVLFDNNVARLPSLKSLLGSDDDDAAATLSSGTGEKRRRRAAATKSNRMATFERLLDAYATLSVDAITKDMHPESFTHQTYPRSLGMPARDLDAFRKHAAGITSIFRDFSMRPQTRSVWEDEAGNSIVAYCHMGGELARGLGPWTNEAVLMVDFTADGRRITGIREFVDSARAKLLMEKLTGSMDGKMDVGKAAADDLQ